MSNTVTLWPAQLSNLEIIKVLPWQYIINGRANALGK
jgi:hypothetical protein